MTDDFKISLTDLQAKAILLEHIVGEISIGYTITDDNGNDLSHPGLLGSPRVTIFRLNSHKWGGISRPWFLWWVSL